MILHSEFRHDRNACLGLPILRKHLQILDNCLLHSKERFWGIAAATISGLAIRVRSSREPDRIEQRVCLSWASYAAAEKSEWRMALKI